MIKKIIPILLCLFLCFSCVGITSSATVIDQDVTIMTIPLILDWNATLSISGNTAYATAYVLCTSDTTGSAINAQLQRITRTTSDNDTWTTIDTYKTSANSNHCSLSDSTSGLNNTTYQYRLYTTFSAVKSNLGSDYKYRIVNWN